MAADRSGSKRRSVGRTLNRMDLAVSGTITARRKSHSVFRRTRSGQLWGLSLFLCVSVVGVVFASDAVAFPETKPGIVGVGFVMPLVHGIEIGSLQWPGIVQGPEPFQPFDLSDGAIDVHAFQCLDARSWPEDQVRAPSVIEAVYPFSAISNHDRETKVLERRLSERRQLADFV